MPLSLLILSDIHAFDGSTGSDKPSYFDISRPDGAGADNPIAHLKQRIAKKKVQADYLVVCGDLGDKAQPNAVQRAWKEIQEIREMVKAKRVVATVGNHDVDSRHKHNDHDAKGLLLELIPGFPFENENENNHFWTHHYSCFRDDSCGARFVVLNSSGYHGEHPVEKGLAEYEHGRVSERTLRRLTASLDAEGRAPVNILVCHHHPQKHDERYLGDWDDMRGGSALLRSLDSAKYGPWIVFHGHKHHPKISYAQGGTDSPIVFSAGSCAAIPQPELLGHARNQVYLVSIDVASTPSSTCTGVFDAWDWGPGIGWNPAQIGSGLPASGGFGFRGDLGAIVRHVEAAVPREEYWKNVKSRVTEIKYLLPVDVAKLCELLQHSGYKVEKGESGEPLIIQR